MIIVSRVVALRRALDPLTYQRHALLLQTPDALSVEMDAADAAAAEAGLIILGDQTGSDAPLHRDPQPSQASRKALHAQDAGTQDDVNLDQGSQHAHDAAAPQQGINLLDPSYQLDALPGPHQQPPSEQQQHTHTSAKQSRKLLRQRSSSAHSTPLPGPFHPPAHYPDAPSAPRPAPTPPPPPALTPRDSKAPGNSAASLRIIDPGVSLHDLLKLSSQNRELTLQAQALRQELDSVRAAAEQAAADKAALHQELAEAEAALFTGSDEGSDDGSGDAAAGADGTPAGSLDGDAGRPPPGAPSTGAEAACTAGAPAGRAEEHESYPTAAAAAQRQLDGAASPGFQDRLLCSAPLPKLSAMSPFLQPEAEPLDASSTSQLSNSCGAYLVSSPTASHLLHLPLLTHAQELPRSDTVQQQLLRSSSLSRSRRSASSELRIIAKERLRDQALRSQTQEMAGLRAEVSA